MLSRLILAFAASLILSSCCEVFGICTSVSVHTAITPPYQVAQQSKESSDDKTPATQSGPETLASFDSSIGMIR
jgi:hypothetical protein